ncbi:MAG: RNA polymerase subunit sigma-70 [Vicinamibacteria bacterium]|nr:RNA polymerase subunit sigma-70 [Vicinamibacteria bacterium]
MSALTLNSAGTVSPRTITRLLQSWQAGEDAALDRLFEHIYPELRRMAEGLAFRNRGHTLEPAALLSEAYIRMVSQRLATLENRRHFFAIASRLMRQVLVDHARERRALKRGGGWERVTLSGIGAPGLAEPDILDLHEALEQLDAVDPRKVRVLEMRYFGGMSLDEIARVEGVVEKTVQRDLRFTEAFLHNALRPRR